MDVILAHFSADNLRVKCATAVQDELQHAETLLHPALDALKRTLSVVHASRKMYKAPLVLVDESPDVLKTLELLLAACSEMGALISELIREVSSVGGDSVTDRSPSATTDQEMRAEPKEAKVAVERKKAAKDTGNKGGQKSNCATTSVAVKAATEPTVIDLSLSDEEESVVVKDEPMKEETQVKVNHVEVATEWNLRSHLLVVVTKVPQCLIT